MRRLMTFLMGMCTGALLLWGALQFHVLHTNQGLHLIRKVNAGLDRTYVDIRGFTVADWARNPELALAITNSNQPGLMGNVADDAIENGLDRWLPPAQQR